MTSRPTVPARYSQPSRMHPLIMNLGIQHTTTCHFPWARPSEQEGRCPEGSYRRSAESHVLINPGKVRYAGALEAQSPRIVNMPLLPQRHLPDCSDRRSGEAMGTNQIHHSLTLCIGIKTATTEREDKDQADD